MRKWSVLVVFIVGFVVFLGVHIYEQSRTPRLDPVCDHASFRTNRWGTKATRELLARLGLNANSWEQSWRQLEGHRGLLFVIHPLWAPSRAEVRALLDWVRAGNHAVVAPDPRIEPRGLTRKDGNDGSKLLAKLGWAVVDTAETGGRISVSASEYGPVRDVKAMELPGRWRLVSSATTGNAEETLQGQAKKHSGEGESEGVPVVKLEGGGCVDDDEGIVVMSSECGRGVITLVSDADLLSNAWISGADNAVLAANMAFAAPGDNVWFDEYHHGHQVAVAGDGPDRAAPHRALWALMAAFGLYFIGKMWRFGEPIEPDRGGRRASVEYVEAFAGLYRRAGRREAALEMVYGRFRRQLAKACGTGPDEVPEELAKVAAQRFGNVRRDELIDILRDCGAAISGDADMTDGELLTLTQRISRVERELETYGA